VGRAVPLGGRRALRRAAGVVGRATSGFRALPDFLLIGAQRGGTTTLYHYLTRHPQIAGAMLDKEVHYFDLHHQRGLDWYRARFPTRVWIRARSQQAGAPILVGESTPYYLFHPAVPRRVGGELPSALAIAMLRDPVERAWSHYRHEVDLGFETLSFEEAVDREDERLAGEEERLLADPSAVSFAHQHYSYLARGRYAEQLERWFETLGRQQVLVLRSEDFFADPAREFVKVLDFLGLEPWSPGSWRAYNAASATDMTHDTRERLRSLFRSHDERLAELLGVDPRWAG
jgi:sulfotransferase family protein